MLVLLTIVLFIVFQVIPEGGMEKFRPVKRGNALLQRATDLEQQSLFWAASDAYRAIVDDARLKPDARYEAALRLARLDQEELADARGAETALEEAWMLAADPRDRQALGDRIRSLRGSPVAPIPLTPVSAKILLASDRDAQAQASRKRAVVAQVGDLAVTMDDLLYAWSQSHALRPPTPDQFGPFVRQYLNMALLADQARREGLESRGRAELELRLARLQTLSKAMTGLLIQALPDPTDKQLREDYAASLGLWRPPARARIGQIVVADLGQARAVSKALGQGLAFAAAARRFSRDADALDEGYLLGEVVEGADAVPGLPATPGLAQVLLSMNDGATTGPLQLADGYHWFKIVEKSAPAEPLPFEQVRDRIAERHQSLALARAREDLLAKLRSSRPIVIHDATLNKAMSGGTVASAAAATFTTTRTQTTQTTTAAGTTTTTASSAPAVSLPIQGTSNR
jgi:parvulin-like peptidyl-prolyl isomerase